jgi:hypothetical protein
MGMLSSADFYPAQARIKSMDAETLFSQLEFNTGQFPEDVLNDAIDQWASIAPLLLEELRSAAADPVALLSKGEDYIRYIYAIYLLAQFREAAAYPLLVDFVATPGEIVMELMGDVVTEDLGRMLASVSHGNLGPIRRLIEDPEVNEWVRSAALDALLVLFGKGQLDRDAIMGYLGELFLLKIERKPSFVWSAMVSAACDLYPEELVEEIRQAYDRGLVDPNDVGFPEVEEILKLGKEKTLEDTLKYQKGLIGNVIDETGWWACFHEYDEEDGLDMDPFELEDDFYSPTVKTVVRQGPKIGRNDLCPCGSGKKYKKCCLHRDGLLH